MEHYSKGENVEEEITRDKIPIPNLPTEFTWMRVRGGSKMRNLVAFALKAFKDSDSALVWTGTGTSTDKAIACAEVMKRTCQAHQITKHCTHDVQEFWQPKLEGLDPLVVTRTLPVVHILLSKQPLDPNEPGYLPPGAKVKKQSRRAPISTMKAEKLSAAEFAALGLRSNTYKRPKPVKNAEKPRPKSGKTVENKGGNMGEKLQPKSGNTVEKNGEKNCEKKVENPKPKPGKMVENNVEKTSKVNVTKEKVES